MTRFALIGAAGYIAAKHLQAIHETGNELVAAVDPHDCVGRLDQHFPEARFFTEIERFDRFLEKRRRGGESERIEYVSICSPNYLHDAHVRMALRARANAICEKPLVISPWNLDALEEIEGETGKRVNTILQLRLHPAMIRLKKEIESRSHRQRAEIELTYVTRRGPWYHVSWKGNEDKSGGLAMNIGIHFFDSLLWLFGEPEKQRLHLRQPDKMSGTMELPGARVRWFLSVDAEDIPLSRRQQGKFAYRLLSLDGQEIDLSEGFTDLHTRTYEEILAGRGYSIADARAGVEAVHAVRQCELTAPTADAHPWLADRKPSSFRRAA